MEKQDSGENSASESDSEDNSWDKEQDAIGTWSTLKFTKDEYNAWWKLWKKSLLARSKGKRVGLNFLKLRLDKLWKPQEEIQVLDLDNDYFLVSFTNQEDFNHAF